MVDIVNKNAGAIYRIWQENVSDPYLVSELLKIKDNDSEIVKLFSSGLSFGTAGARGLIGVGSNRMNSVTVSLLSKAFALYLKSEFEVPSVVISYDTRRFSRDFAEIAAKVLASSGLFVYFFDKTQPIGLLSFSIRTLRCSGGVMITASHNPPEYNGYKVYNSLGAQPIDVSGISDIFNKLEIFDCFNLNFDDFVKMSKIKFVDNSIKEKYIVSIRDKVDLNGVSIAYSPLNGCSMELFERIFENIHVVSEQSVPDSEFATCLPPDPQKTGSFELAINLAKKHNSDVIILNDPDGDRLGVALKSKNGYRILSGIEVSALLVDYIARKSNAHGKFLVKSIVTGGLSEVIADFYGVKCVNVLPGFKYIADFIHKLEVKGNKDLFLIGFEESNGLLLDCSVRDKDGIMAAAYFCDMVAYYKKSNTDCLSVLEGLYNKFGYHSQKNISFVETDLDKIKRLIFEFKNYFESNNRDVISLSDFAESVKLNFKTYEKSKLDFPSCNMICVEFSNECKLFMRASGTEPLIKFYILYSGVTEGIAIENCKKIEKLIFDLYEKCLHEK